MNKKIELVICDCDGVLVDSEPISNKVVAEILTEEGLTMSVEEATNLFAGTNLISIEAYYKKQNNLLSFNEGEILGINEGDEWQEDVPVGEGTSYGVETYFNKNIGKTSWDMNYTWSVSNRTFAEINAGRTFPYRFDRRHNFKIISR